ncbi:valine--tRNA ligase, mitochondrial 1 isoform X2 [Raphanus sativus]|uniref:valine--tRNA ligase n=1 Tax=Raphanus sativus TaxID=3726 RepID=A0A9W3DFT9_RAPSA|nr:valine--tRNA ligase, mitochondrial 1 isoform X2 [Raphanus sativus]
MTYPLIVPAKPSALLINQNGEKGVSSSKAVSGEYMSKKLKGNAVVSSDQVLFFRDVGPQEGESSFRLLLFDEQVYSKASKKLKALEKAKLGAELKAKQSKDVSKKSTKKSSQRDAHEENPEDFVDPETPVCERKQLSLQMAKQYSPAAVERAWYAWWEKAGFFTADAKSSKPAFVIVLPPPNVTGLLHIGHALTTAIQDLIIRWKRMSGFKALWVPGRAGPEIFGALFKIKIKTLIFYLIIKELFLCFF